MSTLTTYATQPSAFQARRDLGNRLRVLRLQANLTGRVLAELMGCHPAKISRIENGQAAPSVSDVRAWCVHCNAKDQAEDLAAETLAVESAYIAWRGEVRRGHLQLQSHVEKIYDTMRRAKVYESRVIPGLLQTQEYTGTILSRLSTRRKTPDDSQEAAAVRFAQRRYLHGKATLSFLIEESVLLSPIAPPEVMRAQYAQLIEDSRLPTVSIGVIPGRSRAQWPVESFYLYDDSLVRVELVSGRWSVNAPSEVGEYVAVFAALAAEAVVGDDARDLITAAMGA